MGFTTNNGRYITLPLELVGDNVFNYLKLDSGEHSLKHYRRYNGDPSSVYDELYPLDYSKVDLNQSVIFELYDEIPCIFGGENGSQTPSGMFKIQRISDKHEEFISGFNESYQNGVKLYGYIEIWEYYWIHSNMYVGKDINRGNFMQHPECKVQNGLNDDGTEHTSGCIRIPDQNKLDELMEMVYEGDIVDTQ